MKLLADLTPEPMDHEGSRAYHGLYKAKVADNDDPGKRGMLKLTIPQVLGANEHPSWAEPVGLSMTPGPGYGSIDLPQVGDWVWVEFEGGNASHPRWRPGWWAESELPEPFKKNYPAVRGFKTKEGHTFYVDDKDGVVHFEHKDGHIVELTNDGVTVKGKDKPITVTAGSAKVTVTSSSKVVIDAPAIEIVEGAAHPLPLFDTFLKDFSQAWTMLLTGLAAGTVGTQAAQALTTLLGSMAELQAFGQKMQAGATYESQKAKNG